jgi:hypothetical protein
MLTRDTSSSDKETARDDCESQAFDGFSADPTEFAKIETIISMRGHLNQRPFAKFESGTE